MKPCAQGIAKGNTFYGKSHLYGCLASRQPGSEGLGKLACSRDLLFQWSCGDLSILAPTTIEPQAGFTASFSPALQPM